MSHQLVCKPVPSPYNPLIFPPNMDYMYLDHAESNPFVDKQKGFSYCNAWWFAELSLAAYEHTGFIRMLFKSIGMSMRSFSSGSTAGFVGWDDSNIFVIYRGTQVKNAGAISDILIDIKFPPEHISSLGSVHAGFYSAFLSLWDGSNGICSCIQELTAEKKRRKVWFSGHSLGGAIATLSYAYFPSATSLYTFGSPKVGDKEFCSKLGPHFFNIVSKSDILARLPPHIAAVKEFPGNIYCHGGQIWMLDREKGYSLSSSEEMDVEFVSAWKNNLSALKNNIFSLFTGKKKQPLRIKNIPHLVTAHLVKDIALHAPVFYAIDCWNAYCKSRVKS